MTRPSDQDQTSGTARVFVALALPPEVKNHLRRFQKKLRDCLHPSAALRWVDPEQIHLTLKFLGNTAVKEFPRVLQALEEAGRGIGPMELEARDLGFFPGPRAPRVCWIGVEGELKALRALQANVDRLMEPWAPRERKSYAPHLTLARVRRSDARLVEDLAALPDTMRRFTLGSWRVEQMDFMRSELRSQGAVHIRLGSVALAGAV